ncbi:hypothetical protein DY000_02029850 [Brassica cretica]|uniref:Uncharacterized protein n=1 Tax=Brassica cretica TaxID=69181 RepID=A0ABQ7DT38_BRACR|nr:hypothetical protein DY000_02029850 [Brassica cretica]
MDEIIRGDKSDKSIPLYRRDVDAEAPLAIFIPARGSFVRMNLRENDLSWNEFLGKAGNMRYAQCIQYTRRGIYCCRETSRSLLHDTENTSTVIPAYVDKDVVSPVTCGTWPCGLALVVIKTCNGSPSNVRWFVMNGGSCLLVTSPV